MDYATFRAELYRKWAHVTHGVHKMTTEAGTNIKKKSSLTTINIHTDNINIHILYHTVNVPCNMQNILGKEWGFQNMKGFIAMSSFICLLSA